MLKISHDNIDNASVILRLEGEIIGPWVDETSRVCERIMSKGQRVRMDLRQVTFADRAGVELLGNLAKREALLDNCSPFLKAQLHSVTGVGDPGWTPDREV
jgi:anti-anti-sigma regulatory factor